MKFSTPILAHSPTARHMMAARAHGVAAFRQLRRICVSYDGQWRWLVRKLQPVLIDADSRKSSKERLLSGRERVIGQRHSDRGRVKQITRQATSVEVHYKGQPSIDRQDRSLRRIRFSMEGLATTQGALVAVDLFDHRDIAGVRWPP